jgi:excisionase family DNA binding protein
MVTEKLEKMALSPDETAQVLGLHVNSVRALIHSGKLPAIKLGRKFLVSRLELQKWLSGNPADTGNSSS